MSESSAFMRYHERLLRQGPGLPEDVVWAVNRAGAAGARRVLDAGCGAGADIPALLAAMPEAHLVAADLHGPFIDRVSRDHPQRVEAVQASMDAPEGPYDFIWCAGAIYFLGVTEGLQAFAPRLSPGACVAFSEPVWTTPTPSDAAIANWADYPPMTDMAGIEARVAAAGYTILDTRLLPPEAWAAYYDPQDALIAELAPGADAEMAQVLEVAAREAHVARTHGDDFTYALLVVRPA